MKSFLLIILLSTLAFSSLSVYISKSNKLTEVSHKDLANLYLKKTKTINGIEVIPIDSQNQKIFTEFYNKIVKKSPKQLHAYWIKEIYRGNKKPPKKLSPDALKKAIKNKTPIITYDKNPKTGHYLLTIK